MEIIKKTIVNISIEEIREMLIKQHGVDSDFELNITGYSEVSETLWYPDDSGGWKEYTKTDGSYPDDVHSETQVEILLREERDKQFYKDRISTADNWNWKCSDYDDVDIVAYKVVK